MVKNNSVHPDDLKRYSPIINALCLIGGVACIIIGVIGGFVPIFPGWVFGLLGLWLLSRPFPRLRHPLRRLRVWIEARTKRAKARH